MASPFKYLSKKVLFDDELTNRGAIGFDSLSITGANDNTEVRN
jgi:hypothetical protein